MFAAQAGRAVGPARPRTSALLTAALVLAAGLLVTPRLTAPASASVAPALSPATARVWARAMLVWLDAERVTHGRAPLPMNAKLVRSAHRHDLAMARADTLSHRLPGEPGFGIRLDDVGYDYASAAENVGYNSRATLAGLRALQLRMYHEQAPDNGHRVNILSRAYRQVGIAVYVDGRGTVWFTQDFGAVS